MNRNPSDAGKIFWLNGIIFLSAFLLFQIELIIAKIFLPKFGGSYLVWGACMVFFQGTLLLGYYYSHLVIQKVGVPRYRFVHIALVLMPLLFFPGRPLTPIHANYHAPFVINIFGQLLMSVGLVFFVLSTTSIIFQGWLAASDLPERSNPYLLYAMSNLGSFAALVTYPLLFEPLFDVHTQMLIWRVTYFFLAALHLVALKYIGMKELATFENNDEGIITGKDKLIWVLLSAASTIMFLSVTNIITYEVTPLPLLWVIPLSLYLASFVFNFKRVPWCPAWITGKFHLTAGFGVIFFFIMQKHVLPFIFEIGACLLLVFITCMFCNYQLYRSKPTGNRHFTTFYLVISFGGFIGSMFITWILPLVSTSMIEFLVSLFLISLALAMQANTTPIKKSPIYPTIYALLMLIIWPPLLQSYNFLAMLSLILIGKIIYSRLKADARALSFNLLCIVGLTPFINPQWSDQKNTISMHRNYYGIYKVFEENEQRLLLSGTTVHGGQYLMPSRQMEPITYYHPATPIHALMRSEEFNFNSIGVVGLGIGTLAAFAKRDQPMDFFEIDPEVYTIAARYFTFLAKSPGKLNFIFGDARVALADNPSKRYDLLVIDAFNNDSIPMHLLTAEAIVAYKRCLADDGIVVFHITNRYLDLRPVIYSNAGVLGAYACIASNRRTNTGGAYASQWAAYTWDEQTFQKLTGRLGWEPLGSQKYMKPIRPWTDAYANIIPAMRLSAFLEQVKNFKPFYWDFKYDKTASSAYQYYRTQGCEYLFKKDFRQAISYYQKAINLNPADADAYFGMGKAFDELKHYAQAISHYQKSIEIDPSCAPVYVNLSMAYLAQGLRQKALATLKSARALFEKQNDAEGARRADELMAGLS